MVPARTKVTGGGTRVDTSTTVKPSITTSENKDDMPNVDETEPASVVLVPDATCHTKDNRSVAKSCSLNVDDDDPSVGS